MTAVAAELWSARLCIKSLVLRSVIRALAIPRMPPEGSPGTESGIEGA
jgi:hypothetical protein